MYRRTGTVMDRNAAFFPQTQLGHVPGLGDAGEFGEGYDYYGGYVPGEVYTDPAAQYAKVDTASYYGTDYSYIPPTPTPAQAAISSGSGAAFADALKALPAAVRDIYLANNQAEAQKKLMDLNIARAQRGLQPINMQSYLPAQRPGAGSFGPGGMGQLAPSQIAAGVGVALGLAYFLTRRRSRRSR